VATASVQLIKSELCCITKLAEGTIHESVRLPFAGVMFICGAGVVCKVQIPLSAGVQSPAAATNLHPSADEATQLQLCTATLLCIHVAPESVEE